LCDIGTDVELVAAGVEVDLNGQLVASKLKRPMDDERRWLPATGRSGSLDKDCFCGFVI
jgi:hypothetical protein